MTTLGSNKVNNWMSRCSAKIWLFQLNVHFKQSTEEKKYFLFNIVYQNRAYIMWKATVNTGKATEGNDVWTE